MAVATDGTGFVVARSPRRRARRVLGIAVTRVLRRFGRREEGSAAIEFGMVAAPFLGLLFAILETALVFFANQTLETAVADAGRLILTGQAQSAGYSQSTFLEQVCPKVSALFNCTGLMVDVQNYTSFPSAPTLPIDSQGKLQNNFVYEPGVAGNIVVVRLMYEWPVYVPVIGYINAFKTNLVNGNQLLMATAAFRNEPYGP